MEKLLICSDRLRADAIVSFYYVSLCWRRALGLIPDLQATISMVTRPTDRRIAAAVFTFVFRDTIVVRLLIVAE